jgi:pyrroloquinoline quinone (PQQ) biosynthesis protein C
MTESLEKLLAKITNHSALENKFYDEWMSRKFSVNELAIVHKNYGEWVRSFPDALAILLAGTQDVEAKTEYAKTLYSEMGYGNSSKVHSVLLNNFFKELVERMDPAQAADWERLHQEIYLAPSTQELVRGEQDLYRDPEMSFGAQLALEWQAYTMLRKLYDGARNYIEFWPNPDDFHEACEYFYAHIGATEKEHKQESLKAVRRYAVNQKALDKIVEGYELHLGLIARFWRGLYAEITQPSAISMAIA